MHVEVRRSIQDVREIWDRVAPRGRVILESAHLEAIERSGVNEATPYYLLVKEGERVAGIAYCFAMQLDMASLDKALAKADLVTLRTWTPGFLISRILECGIVSGLGETIAAADADRPQVCQAVAREMVRLAQEAGAELVLVRDIPHAQLERYSPFLDEGYAPLLGFPQARLDARWASFDDYLVALKSHTRQDVRRALLRRPPDVEVVRLEDFPQHALRLAELWGETSRRAADYSHERLNAAYFREIARCLPHRSRVIALRRRGQLLGFVLALLGDSEYFAVHCGVDYDQSQGDNLYDLLMVSVIRDAFESGLRSLNWGITTYDYKLKRGFEAEPVVYFVRHVREPRLTVALARSLQKGIVLPENTHRPFRDLSPSCPGWSTLAAQLPVTPPPPTTDVFSKASVFDRPNGLRLASLYSFFPPFESAQGPLIRRQGQEVVMLGSNAYLGLCTDPRVCTAARDAIETYGTGCSGSPLLNGTLDIHVDLARALAEFMGKEDALLCSTGYQTNLGVVSALVGKDDVIVMDRLDHASLFDGSRLSGATVARYRHNDMDSLERTLEAHQGRGVLVVVDSVFSMEGAIANLPAIVSLAQRYGARTMVDEAHGIGVLGAGGRGAAELTGVLDQVDIVMGTFSKSFASLGGFVAGRAYVIDFLRHAARSHLFSASLPPPAVAAARAALEIIRHEPERRVRLLRNAEYMSRRLQTLGYDAPFRRTAIVPVHCGSDALALGAFKRLLERGVFVNPVLDPAVPRGRELLRTSYMATHSIEMLERALEVFAGIRTPSFPRRPASRPLAMASRARLRVRPLVLLPVANRSSLVRLYRGVRAGGTVLRVPGFTRLHVGQLVDCGISFGSEGVIVQARGRVVSRCLAPAAGRPLGVEVELLQEEARTRELLERFLEGENVLPAARHSWRYHAEIDVACAPEEAQPEAVTALDDISVEGAALRGPCPVTPRTSVPLWLRPPDSDPIRIDGEVRWRRGGDAPGFGVQFQYTAQAEEARVRALIGEIKQAMAAGSFETHRRVA